MWPTRYFYPEAVGYLVARTVRCGKVNCRCRRLGERHGPYWYLYYRAWDGERWRQRARYVRADRVEALRRRLERVKAVERLLECLSSQGRLRALAAGSRAGAAPGPMHSAKNALVNPPGG